MNIRGWKGIMKVGAGKGIDYPSLTSMPITWLLHENHHSLGPEDIKVQTAAFDDVLTR